MKAVVDTSVLTDALLKQDATGDAARSSLKSFTESLLPKYAIKEFKNGPLHYYVWFHNKVVEAATWTEAVEAIQKVFRQAYRQATAIQALKDFSSSIGSVMTPEISAKYPGSTLDEFQKEEARIWLRKLITQAWQRRGKLVSAVTMKLPCYVEKEPSMLVSGQIDDKPRKCNVTDCSLRIRYADRVADIELLEKACASEKPEVAKRRRALNRLRRHPKSEFDEEYCRALGDAVFSLECPKDAVILTTNVSDHEPLAAALKRTVQKPT